MPTSFDYAPTYDPIVSEKNQIYMSPQFADWLNTHINTLVDYLTQYGIKWPPLTTAQRDSIINPINGLTIYNTTLNVFQGYQAGAWKTFVTI